MRVARHSNASDKNNILYKSFYTYFFKNFDIHVVYCNYNKQCQLYTLSKISSNQFPQQRVVQLFSCWEKRPYDSEDKVRFFAVHSFLHMFHMLLEVWLKQNKNEPHNYMTSTAIYCITQAGLVYCARWEPCKHLSSVPEPEDINDAY